MACLMAELFDLPKDHLEQDLSAATQKTQLRPIDARLDVTESFHDIDNFKPEKIFKEALRESLMPFKN